MRILFCLFLLSTLCFFSQNSRCSECSQPPVRILVLGSSTAEGTGASIPRNSWVSQLENKLKKSNKSASVINFGRSGYSTFHILPSNSSYENRPPPDVERNITKALELNPTLVIINMPSNDASYGYSNEEQLRNYRIMVDLLERRKIRYLIISPQPRNFTSMQTRKQQLSLHHSLKSEFSRNFVDVWQVLVDEDLGLKDAFGSGDGIHLNDFGHTYIFEQVYAWMK